MSNKWEMELNKLILPNEFFWDKDSICSTIHKRIVDEAICKKKDITENPSFHSFYRSSTIASCIMNCAHESVKDLNSNDGVTLKILNNAWTGDFKVDVPDSQFDSEGGGKDKGEWIRQVTQQLDAQVFLFSKLKEDLSVEIIKETHLRLLKGSTNDGISIQAGKYREYPMHSSGSQHIFRDAKNIPKLMINIVNNYNKCKLSSPIKAATKFLYEFLETHPFENGNGRLSRMLFSWCVMSQGFPFPVSLSTDRYKSRKHWGNALKKIDNGVEEFSYKNLNSIVIYSLNSVISNWISYTKLMS